MTTKSKEIAFAIGIFLAVCGFVLALDLAFTTARQQEEKRYADVASHANASGCNIISIPAEYSIISIPAEYSITSNPADYPPAHFSASKLAPHIYSSSKLNLKGDGIFTAMIGYHSSEHGDWLALFRYHGQGKRTRECGYRYLHKKASTHQWVYKSLVGGLSEQDCWQLIMAANDAWYNPTSGILVRGAK